MKQINVKLLAILFISTVLTLAGSFFLYRFQKDRNADGLIVRADEKQHNDHSSYSTAHVSNGSWPPSLCGIATAQTNVTNNQSSQPNFVQG